MSDFVPRCCPGVKTPFDMAEPSPWGASPAVIEWTLKCTFSHREHIRLISKADHHKLLR